MDKQQIDELKRIEKRITKNLSDLIILSAQSDNFDNHPAAKDAGNSGTNLVINLSKIIRDKS